VYINKWFTFGILSAVMMFSGLAIAGMNSGDEYMDSDKQDHALLDKAASKASMDDEAILVDIDVLPGNTENQFASSNPDLDVVLLGSDDFNVSTVDLNSLTLNETSYEGQPMMADTNGDGWEDLIFVFAAQDLDLHADANKLTLKGKTKDGKTFSGSDNVSVTK